MSDKITMKELKRMSPEQLKEIPMVQLKKMSPELRLERVKGIYPDKIVTRVPQGDGMVILDQLAPGQGCCMGDGKTFYCLLDDRVKK